MDRLVCSGGTWQTPAIDSCGGLDAGGIRDVGSDANDACDDEGTFYCAGGSGTVCCAGHRVAFEDGPCGLFPDAGEDAGLCPNALGCPCDADAGAAPCLDYTYAVCTGGTWRRGSHACGICSR
jgi:hypothetical protein